MLDGFDVLVMSFTAPYIAEQWQIPNTELGLLFSAGLFGMAAGSLFLAPYSDRFGRKYIILLCLLIITLGMLLSAACQSVIQLACMRFITGLGIGGILASANVLVAEFSSIKYRSLAIGLFVGGYPVGATLGGSVAIFLISNYGWQSAFVFGGLVSLLMIPLVLWQLPESVDFIISKRPVNALHKINTILSKMGHTTISSLPEVDTSAGGHKNISVRELLTPDLRKETLLTWTAFFTVMAALYFILSWTPKLLVDAGLSAQQGVSGAVILNLGGVVGCFIIGILATRFKLQSLNKTFTLITGILMILFGIFSGSFGMAFGLAILIGIFIFGTMVGLYALAPAIYDARIRGTGMGWAIGIGRVGAIIAPLIAGVLLDFDLTATTLYIVFSLAMFIAFITQLYIKKLAM